MFRSKSTWSPRSSTFPTAEEAEKEHGEPRETKNTVNRTLRRDRRRIVGTPSDVSHSGFCSASTDHQIKTEDSEDENEVAESTNFGTSDMPPQVAPLHPASKLLPKLAISIPTNGEIENSIAVALDTNEDEDAESETETSHVAPLRLRSSKLTSSSRNGSSTTETSFHYTASAKADDDVFSDSQATSRIDLPVSSFIAKLQEAMEQTSEEGIRTRSVTSTASRMLTPSPSPMLRHTALSLNASLQSDSLRSQYSASEPAASTSVLNTSKMQLQHNDEADKTLRVAPSLEEGLCADDLKVFEEDVLAAATPILRNIDPDLVDVRHSKVGETCERPTHAISDDQCLGNDLAVGPLVLPDPPGQLSPEFSIAPLHVASERLSAACSSSTVSAVIPTLPFQILETVVFFAAYGDVECRNLASNLYKEAVEAEKSGAESRWGVREQHLLRRSHIVQELDSMMRHGYLRQNFFETIRQQLFPTGRTKLMESRHFTMYVFCAVCSFVLDEDMAKQIVELAINDEPFYECSPEEETFFRREAFNTEGFVYSDRTDDDHYERLSSMPSTVDTFESAKPRPQSGGRLSKFFSKVALLFRFGHGRRTSQTV
ncbi:hypothetical protein EKO04_009117 [Ascochyta lentis]|uniref:Uncharacterized protein n=1 Tax=Ascochyta lentis TaxID=205686 RepID=A0A8H7IU72_9PLEO|nr:hypothetical protein EKO04_009117 [Ascochyta lentis]